MPTFLNDRGFPRRSRRRCISVRWLFLLEVLERATKAGRFPSQSRQLPTILLPSRGFPKVATQALERYPKTREQEKPWSLRIISSFTNFVVSWVRKCDPTPLKATNA